MRSICGLILFAVLGLAPWPSVAASFSVSYDANLVAGATGAPVDTDGFHSGDLEQLSISRSLAAAAEGLIASGEVSFRGTAAIGRLSSFGEGAASISAVSAFGSGTIFSGLHWADTMTITSDTLAPGTPVQFLVTMQFDRSLGQMGSCPGTVARLRARFNGFGRGLAIDDDTCAGLDPDRVDSVLVNTQIGADVAISGTLALDLGVHASTSGDSASSAFADAEHTALVFLESRTPGADYRLASGSRLAPTLVPEPATGATILVALSLASGLRARRALLRPRPLNVDGGRPKSLW